MHRSWFLQTQADKYHVIMLFACYCNLVLSSGFSKFWASSCEELEKIDDDIMINYQTSRHVAFRLCSSFCCPIYCWNIFTCSISLLCTEGQRLVVSFNPASTFLGFALVASSLWTGGPGMKQKYSVVWCARKIYDIDSDTPLPVNWSYLTKPAAASIVHVFTDHSSEVEPSESGELTTQL